MKGNYINCEQCGKQKYRYSAQIKHAKHLCCSRRCAMVLKHRLYPRTEFKNTNYKHIPATELIELYTKQHIPTAKLSKKYNINRNTLCKKLKKLGINVKYYRPKGFHRIKLTDEITKIIEQEYVIKKKPTEEICKIVGFSKPTILRFLKELGLVTNFNKYRKINNMLRDGFYGVYEKKILQEGGQIINCGTICLIQKNYFPFEICKECPIKNIQFNSPAYMDDVVVKNNRFHILEAKQGESFSFRQVSTLLTALKNNIGVIIVKCKKEGDKYEIERYEEH